MVENDVLKKGYIQKALTWVEKKGYLEIKADIEGLETPKSFTQRSSDTAVYPDMTAKSLGRKFYFEVALKSSNERDIVTKWKLLSQLAAMKEGKLIVFTPHGHRAFAEKIIEKHRITAKIIPLRSIK